MPKNDPGAYKVRGKKSSGVKAKRRKTTPRHKIGPEGGSPIIRREQPRPGPSPIKRRKKPVGTPETKPGEGGRRRQLPDKPQPMPIFDNPKRRKTRVRHPSVKPGLVRGKQAPKPGTTPTRRRGQLTPRRGRA
ncbi:MAG: hypothetical protein QQN63_04850 [Nitrosopumilus sp.]